MNPQVLQFVRAQKWAVQASVATDGSPQAAVIGIVIDDRGHVFFDTSSESRKALNLRHEPRIALVIGWDDSQTVQLQGVADEPTGHELEKFKELYFERFPDGRKREADPDIVYFRVRPTWVRYSDFRSDPPHIRILDGRHSS